VGGALALIRVLVSQEGWEGNARRGFVKFEVIGIIRGFLPGWQVWDFVR